MFSYFVLLQNLLHLNPFTAPASKISGLKRARARLKNSIFFAPITSTFNAVRRDESPFICQCENEDKGFRVSNFALLLVGFKRHHGNERVTCYSNHKHFLYQNFQYCIGILPTSKTNKLQQIRCYLSVWHMNDFQ